ncbi:MAG: hypothetical protein RR632_03940 [Christensenella sp.]
MAGSIVFGSSARRPTHFSAPRHDRNEPKSSIASMTVLKNVYFIHAYVAKRGVARLRGDRGNFPHFAMTAMNPKVLLRP